MANDYITDEEQKKDREIEIQLMMQEAAMYVIDGDSRKNAIERVENLYSQREEAKAAGQVVLDEEGFVDTYAEPELNPPSLSDYNPQQVETIAQELRDSYS